MTRVFAYARVSTADQITNNQRQEINAAGFDVLESRYVEEVVSGAIVATERKGFAKLLDRMEAGDVLVVTKLDRLGRNAMDVRATVERLATLAVKVHCLQLGGADLTSAAGKMIMGVIGAMAEFERDLLIERTQAGLARAKCEGKTLGRPTALTAQQRQAALAMVTRGESIAAIARQLDTSRQTIMRLRDAQAVATRPAE